MSEAPVEGRITTELRGHVLLIGIDRAAKRNAFGPEMLEGLARAYAQLEETAEARCALLFANGEHFTAGLDLVAVAPLLTEKGFVPPGGYDPWGMFGKRRTKPVVVAVQGRCLTLGIELVLASDVTVAATDTRFAQIEIKRGIFPFGGATLRFPERCGWGNAMRWLLTGDEFDAREALRIGLVQEVVEPGQQFSRGLELAQKIAAQSPLGVRATLRNAWLASEQGPAAAVQQLTPELMKLLESEDVQEGMASFIERREAAFKGR